MTFEKDGDFEYNYLYEGYSYGYKGEWEFSGDKEDLEVTIENQVNDWEILRLTNKELWFEDDTNTEFRLEAK